MTQCRIRPLRLHVHPEPDVQDLRLSMAVDSVRFRTTTAGSTTTLGAITTRDLGPDSCPERNTRETFAEIALELGFREKSSEGMPVFIPSRALSVEE